MKLMMGFIILSMLTQKRRGFYLALGIVLYDSFFLQLMITVRHWLFFQSALLSLYLEVLMDSGNEIFSYDGPYGTSINKSYIKPYITLNSTP